MLSVSVCIAVVITTTGFESEIYGLIDSTSPPECLFRDEEMKSRDMMWFAQGHRILSTNNTYMLKLYYCNAKGITL